VKSLRVAVLGAGPAGLSTALAVARAGHRALLVDRGPVEVTSAQRRSSTGQWYARAIDRSRMSGFTAVGRPTMASIA
jgi:2-polyprenyl-6-methoxyphenol hydroxylase-like FAD-dependent oxidoreductase